MTLRREPCGVRHALLEEFLSGLAPYDVFRYRNWMDAYVSQPEMTPKNLVLLAKFRRAIEVQRGYSRLEEGDFVRHDHVEMSWRHFDGSGRTFRRALSLALRVGALYHHHDGLGGRRPGGAQYEVGRNFL